MQPIVRMTEDEYLARERVAETKSELLNGHVIAMAGASPRHNAIVANVLCSLGNRLQGKGCRPYASDLRIHVPATGLYTYPGASIICGEPERHPKDRATVTNPRVLIEVLSDDTEAYDRGAKFAHYRSITNLDTYVLVAQHEARVEWFERTAEGKWTLSEAVSNDAALDLRSVGVTVPLAELYAELPAA